MSYANGSFYSFRDRNFKIFQLRGIDFEFRQAHVRAARFLRKSRPAQSQRQRGCAKELLDRHRGLQNVSPVSGSGPLTACLPYSRSTTLTVVERGSAATMGFR